MKEKKGGSVRFYFVSLLNNAQPKGAKGIPSHQGMILEHTRTPFSFLLNDHCSDAVDHRIISFQIYLIQRNKK
jgi:hypothetical protein